CLIRLGFARSFRTAVQELKEKSEDNKEEKETKEMEAETKIDVTMNFENAIASEEKETSSINVIISEEESQTEKLELNVQNTLKDIGIRLSKIQESHREHYRLRFENTLENLSSGKCKEYFQKLKDALADMKAQGYVAKSSFILSLFFFFSNAIKKKNIYIYVYNSLLR
ncbi:hypothetical protein RFI_34520, partial [Reticulomyxa filosa]